MENIAKHCLLTRVYASLGWFGRAVFDLTVLSYKRAAHSTKRIFQ
jgi:hypothetical protein